MYTNKFFVALIALCLVPLACGPGDQSTDAMKGNTPDMTMTSDKGDMVVVPKNGTLVINVAPMGKDMMVELDVDGTKMATIKVGSSNEFTLTAGSHDVRLTTPGYGYAVPLSNFNWDTQGGSVNNWVIQQLSVTANTKVDVEATLCRDLTGTWNVPVVGPQDVFIQAINGKCVTKGFSIEDFTIDGDNLTVNSGDGCAGVQAKLSPDAKRIDLDCGNGETYVFTKQ